MSFHAVETFPRPTLLLTPSRQARAEKVDTPDRLTRGGMPAWGTASALAAP